MISPHPDLEPLVPPVPPARPRALAVLGLVAAVLGLVAAFGGFVPGLGLPAVIVAGVLLLVGLVLCLIALISRRQGGTGLSVTGVIVAVLGGIVFVVALVVATWTGLSAQSAAVAPAPDAQVSDTSEQQAAAEAAAQAAGEKAFLADARPQIRDIVKQIRLDATDAQIDGAYSDDILKLIGYSVLEAYRSGGDAAVADQVDQLRALKPGAFTKPQATRLVDVVLKAAEDHLRP
ncbi:hypothetical protein [Microbacterium terrisoli]|uniref:hypothetical protein n=1 Tax=Microbacterium terrisoli TaxID=3242192 RepID=UPI002805549A|nr:hypothetical protein [Microbacterium protaetiae]